MWWFKKAKPVTHTVNVIADHAADAKLTVTSSRLEKELQTYRSHLESMLSEHRNQFVLIKGSTIVGYYRSRPDAVRAAFQTFERAPVLIKQVTDHERIHRLSGATV